MTNLQYLHRLVVFLDLVKDPLSLHQPHPLQFHPAHKYVTVTPIQSIFMTFFDLAELLRNMTQWWHLNQNVSWSAWNCVDNADITLCFKTYSKNFKNKITKKNLSSTIQEWLWHEKVVVSFESLVLLEEKLVKWRKVAGHGKEKSLIGIYEIRKRW